MNILFLSTHLNTGGITSYLFTLGKGLVGRGHQVHVMTSGGNCEKDFLNAGMSVENVDIKTKSELSFKIYGNLSRIKRYIVENQIDVIHAQTRVTQVAGRFLSKLTGRPYVSTCHGFFRPRLSRKLFPCWGARVIAISHSVVTHLHQDFRIPLDRIDFIPNGIDVDAFSVVLPEDKLKKREKFLLGNEPLVGIIARLSDVKGQDVLVSAFQKVVSVVRDAKLLLVGEGKMEPMLRDLVDRLNLKESVIFMPVVNNTAEILSLLDVFVMPSRQEGLGLSVMEAQASGLPVVASRVGGIPSLIDSGKDGILVEPEMKEPLADAIVELLQTREKAAMLGCAARKRAEEHYASEIMVEKTLQVYQKVL